MKIKKYQLYMETMMKNMEMSSSKKNLIIKMSNLSQMIKKITSPLKMKIIIINKYKNRNL